MAYRPVWKEGDPQPLCICGCERPVKVARCSDTQRGLKAGQPYNYAFNCASRLRNRNIQEMISSLNAARLKDTLPMEPFRAEVLRIKEEKGLTWPDVNRISGRFVRSACQKRSQKLVTREFAADVLSKLRSTDTVQIVPMDKFIQELAKIKERRGLTWDEMNEITGHDVKSLCTKKRQKSVSRHYATTVLKRLAGIATPPTPIEHKRMMQYNHRVAMLEYDIQKNYEVA